MKRKIGRKRFSLTLIFSLIVFVILFIALCLAGITVYALIHLEFLAPGAEIKITTDSIALALAVSLVIGVGITFLLLKVPLKPVNDLINSLHSLSEGNFKTRLYFKGAVTSHPAFAEISESFNILASELEKTEMLRSDFINNFSHEFKTPIVSVAGLAKLVNKGNLTDEQRSEYLTAIEKESMRLATIATNVLNLTKIENQEILTDTTVYNISEQIRSCILLLENKWLKKDISFSLDLEEYKIDANEELLKQVWINLIDNAIKFSPYKEIVEIGIVKLPNTISVSISNRSEEIPQNEMHNIFGKFYQLDKSHSVEGNGIGLAIVKKIVDLHKGAVGIENKDGNVIFTVSLPCSIP